MQLENTCIKRKAGPTSNARRFRNDAMTAAVITEHTVTFFAVQIVLSVLTTALPFLRFYALRRNPARTTGTAARLADAFFVLAAALAVVLAWYGVYYTSVQLRVMKHSTTQLEVAVQLATVNMEKVALTYSITNTAKALPMQVALLSIV